MAHFDMNLQPQPFQAIATGRKTIELRLWDERRQGIKKGDLITFACNGQTLTVKVVALHLFDSFAQLYANMDLLKCGYTAENVATAHPDDMLQYYPSHLQAKYGVVGIQIQLLC